MRKEVRNILRAGEALLVCITTQDFSDEEFEAIKEMIDSTERTIFVYHIQDSAPPSEMYH